MKYALIKVSRGRTTIMDSGPLPKMNRRLRELRSGTAHGKTGASRKVPVRYDLIRIEP